MPDSYSELSDIDEAGEKPVAQQCQNRRERNDVDCNRRSRIRDRFGPEFRFLDLKIARQQCRVAGEAGMPQSVW